KLAGERDDRAFGASVRRVAWEAAAAVHRRDVDDRAAAPLDHAAGRLLRAEEVAAHVEVEYFVVDLRRRLQEVERPGHASVVYQHVEPAERADRVLDDAAAVLDAAEVALDRQRPTAHRLDLGDGVAGALLAAGVVHRDVGALARQLQRDPLPDAHTGAR